MISLCQRTEIEARGRIVYLELSYARKTLALLSHKSETLPFDKLAPFEFLLFFI
jgi:hypothetical protein